MTKRFDLHAWLDGEVESHKRLGRKEKKRKPGALCETAGCHRKSLIRLLSGRSRVFVGKHKARAIGARRNIWKRAHRPSSERLAEQMEFCLPFVEEFAGPRTDEVFAQPRSSSARQISRRLHAARRAARRHLNSWTMRSRMLRRLMGGGAQRPRDPKPGLSENDTGAHCGDSMRGHFLRTLCSVDVATGWVCAEPVAGIARPRAGDRHWSA